MPDNDAGRTKTPEGQGQKGQFNVPNVTALQGNITSDGTFIESRILARRTLMEAFATLGENMAARLRALSGGETKPVDLILYNPTDIPNIELYAGVMRQVLALDAEYSRVNAYAGRFLEPADQPAATPQPGGNALEEDVRPKGSAAVGPNALGVLGTLAAPGPAVAGYAVGAVLRTAADLASLFKVDTDFKNFDLPIDDTALLAEFRKVVPREWKVWPPAQFPVEAAGGYDPAGSELLRVLERVAGKNALALSLAAKIKDKDVLAELNALNAIFAQLQALLTSVDSTSRITTMGLLLRAERLIALMKKDGTYVVRLAAISRGSNKVSKWIWSSAKIRHSAGTELNCIIFAPSGEVVFADTQLRYTAYRLPGEIGNL